MAKESRYQSKQPDAEGRIAYSAAENTVWHDLYARQEALLPGRVCAEFLAGLHSLDLPRNRVPQISEVNARLAEASGFGIEAVPALISPKQFFALLADRKFPVATFIRRREDFDYLQEPDVFHEIFGHCPMLANPTLADFLQRYGQMALKAGDAYLWMLQRLFWFTIEFGLIETPSGLRIYGAGIASSPGETRYALEDKTPERQPFDALTVFRTPYRIDILQPVYYVIESFEQLYALAHNDLGPLVTEAKRQGPLAPAFEPLRKESAA